LFPFSFNSFLKGPISLGFLTYRITISSNSLILFSELLMWYAAIQKPFSNIAYIFLLPNVEFNNHLVMISPACICQFTMSKSYNLLKLNFILFTSRWSTIRLSVFVSKFVEENWNKPIPNIRGHLFQYYSLHDLGLLQ